MQCAITGFLFVGAQLNSREVFNLFFVTLFRFVFDKPQIKNITTVKEKIPV